MGSVLTFSGHALLGLMLVDDLLRLLDGGEGVQDLVEARVSLVLVQKLCELLHCQVRFLLSPPEKATGGCEHYGAESAAAAAKGTLIPAPPHCCQPLSGVNLSPEFVNLYFPYAGRGLLLFCWWQQCFEFQLWKEKAVMCKIQTRNLKSHFRRDFLAYCTRPVSVLLAMACVGCSFNKFSVFLLCFTQQQNLMKLMFSCIHFQTWPYPPK